VEFQLGLTPCDSFIRSSVPRASTQPYEYSDYNSSDEQSLTFDSYTIPEDDLELGQLRLLEVDNYRLRDCYSISIGLLVLFYWFRKTSEAVERQLS
jgi:hypothetical protein